MDDRSRSADVKVGLFVVTALTILVFGSLWIVGSTFFGARRVSYDVVMKEAAGVDAGDRVRFAGVPVGRTPRRTLHILASRSSNIQVRERPRLLAREFHFNGRRARRETGRTAAACLE